jgi:hypothetical protein
MAISAAFLRSVLYAHYIFLVTGSLMAAFHWRFVVDGVSGISNLQGWYVHTRPADVV